MMNECLGKGHIPIAAKYIVVTSIKSGLMIIHQNLAHQRIFAGRFAEKHHGTGTLASNYCFPCHCPLQNLK